MLNKISGIKLLDPKLHHFKTCVNSMSGWKSFFPNQKFFTHVFGHLVDLNEGSQFAGVQQQSS